MFEIMNWNNTTLNDISINIQTGPFGSQLHQSDYAETGIPVVMPKDLIDGHIDVTTIARVQEKHVERLSRHKIIKGDILYPRRGDIGKCAFSTEKEEGWLCGTGCLRVTIDETIANPKFVFYQLFTNESKGWIEKHAVGATMLNLNTSILERVPVKLPELRIQNSIASILSSYDDLIENNQKQIKLLEEAARRLYKEWFVDLHFSGHEQTKIVDSVPDGWRSCNIEDLISYEIGGGWGEDTPTNNCIEEAYVIRGTDLYSVKQGRFEDIPCRFHSKSNLNSRRLSDGDIIFEVSGGSKNTGAGRSLLIRAEILNLLKMPVMCASFCKLIRLEDNHLSQYFYDYLQYCKNSGITEKYDMRSASSIVNYRWKDFLTQEKILMPPNEILKYYSNFADANYHKMMNCALQINLLRNARNRLLPKLMNGEIEL